MQSVATRCDVDPSAADGQPLDKNQQRRRAPDLDRRRRIEDHIQNHHPQADPDIGKISGDGHRPHRPAHLADQPPA